MPASSLSVLNTVYDNLTRVRQFISSPPPPDTFRRVGYDGIRAGCDVLSAVPERVRGFSGLLLASSYACGQYWSDNNYSPPQLGQVTRIVVQLFSFGGSCEPFDFSPTVVWPGVHEGITIATPAQAPTACIPQGNLGNGVVLTDSNGDTLVALTGAGNRQPAEIVSVTVATEPTPGPNPAPDPGIEFDPFPTPGLPGIPSFPLPDFADDPVLGPDVPVPTFDPEPPYAQAGEPLTAIPDSGQPQADNPVNILTGGRFLIGAVVTVIQEAPGGNTVYFQGSASPLTVPRHGNLYFAMRLGEDLCWSSPYPITGRREYVPSPEGQPACGAYFYPAPGVQATITAIVQTESGEVEETTLPCA